MATSRKPTRSSVSSQAKPEPAPPLQDDLAIQAVRSLVDMSWDASAGTWANLHEMAHLQAHTLTNFNKILQKAALDSASAHDIQGLLRANAEFGTAILGEAATFMRELLGLMVADQQAIARSAMTSLGATSSSGQSG